MSSKKMELKLTSLSEFIINKSPRRKSAFTVIFVFLCLTAWIWIGREGMIAEAQKFKTGPGIRLEGEIKKGVDVFGHQKYSGTLANHLAWRVDYVRVEFKLFNKTGRILHHKDVFVKGSEFIFQDSSISKSSIEPDQKADFLCLTPIHVDSITKFSYKVYWMEYDSLPKEAF